MNTPLGLSETWPSLVTWKVNVYLRRLAGLLKLWLAEKRGQGAKPIGVEVMIMRFRVLQAQILDLMSRIVYK